MNHLYRELAPITDAAWAEIDGEATKQLTTVLAARKLVDFEGPHGWDYSATNRGRAGRVDGPVHDQVEGAVRRVLPVVELRAFFELSRDELDDVERGATDPDLDALDDAARRIGVAENRAVFHGYGAGGVAGIADACSHPPITLDDDFHHYPRHVANAVSLLLEAGVGGPYALALGPDGYRGVIETTEHGGYPLFDHLRNILGGSIVWAPGVEGAVVLSQRGHDFVFESGQDLAIGYHHSTDASVRLYLEESFTVRVDEPKAAVCLRSGS